MIKIIVTHIVFSLILLTVTLSVRAEAATCGFPQSRHPANWSSQSFYQQYPLPSAQREKAVIEQVMAGNIPEAIRDFATIEIPARWQGVNVTLELDVTQDYLTIGNSRDFVRAPLTNYAAQYLASRMGLYLPTAFIVDKIYQQADTKLAPQPTDWYKKSPNMQLGTNYVLFTQMIEQQRAGRGGLVAGHKKDVVFSHLLDSAPGRVAIYGWHRTNGQPIQPLATPHTNTYEDYSHGIRFVGPQVRIRGGRNAVLSFAEVMADRELGMILNGGRRPPIDLRAARSCESNFANVMGLSGTQCPPAPTLCQ